MKHNPTNSGATYCRLAAKPTVFPMGSDGKNEKVIFSGYAPNNFKSKDGKRNDTLVSFELIRKAGELSPVEQYVGVGDRIMVSYQPKTDIYTTKAGKTDSKTVLQVTGIQILSSKAESETRARAHAQAAAEADESVDDMEEELDAE